MQIGTAELQLQHCSEVCSPFLRDSKDVNFSKGARELQTSSLSAICAGTPIQPTQQSSHPRPHSKLISETVLRPLPLLCLSQSPPVPHCREQKFISFTHLRGREHTYHCPWGMWNKLRHTGTLRALEQLHQFYITGCGCLWLWLWRQSHLFPEGSFPWEGWNFPCSFLPTHPAPSPSQLWLPFVSSQLPWSSFVLEKPENTLLHHHKKEKGLLPKLALLCLCCCRRTGNVLMGCYSFLFKRKGGNSGAVMGFWWSREAHLSCTAQRAGPRAATGSTQSAETRETQKAFVSFPLHSLLILHPKMSSSEVNGKHPASTKFFLPVFDEGNP